MPVDATHPLAKQLARRLGKAVHHFRSVRGISQIELAERVGVSMQTVSNIERGEGTSIAVVAVLADVLGVRVGDLVADSAAEPEDPQADAAAHAFARIPRRARAQALDILRVLAKDRSDVADAPQRPMPKKRSSATRKIART